MAQRKAYLAFIHLMQLSRYGQGFFYGIDGEPEKMADDPTKAKMASASELFVAVETELLDALGVDGGITSSSIDTSNSLLPEHGLTENGFGEGNREFKITRTAALTMLADLYLNAKWTTGTAQWLKAHHVATKIVSDGHYKLSDSSVEIPNKSKRLGSWDDPDTVSGWDALFAPNNAGNPELIFAIDLGGRWSKAGYKPPGFQGMNHADMSNYYLPDSYGRQGWCGINNGACIDLCKAAKDNALAPESKIDVENCVRETCRGGCNGPSANPFTMAEWDDADPRKKRTFNYGVQRDLYGNVVTEKWDDGEKSLIFGKAGSAKPLEFTVEIPELYPSCNRHAGARYNKYKPYIASIGSDMMTNWAVYRYAEVLFMQAEAAAHGGASSELQPRGRARQREPGPRPRRPGRAHADRRLRSVQQGVPARVHAGGQEPQDARPVG